ncbi:MAG: hypothetical protein ACJAVN_002826 [Roseivirga sp.]|jgi:hypothetical protein
MRLKLYLLLTVLFISFEGFAQDRYTVKGTVKDAVTGDLMPFATVFFAETTFGTATDDQGKYTLTVSNPGTYDFIVKFVGYKTYATQLKLGDQAEITMDVLIEADAKSLGDVVVTAKKDEKWQEHMREFRLIFLGESANARQCKILNEEVIDFIFDEEKVILEAFSSEPLIIENKALGYKIQYFLEHFEVNYTANISSYYGYTVFEELKSKSQRKINRWEANRKKAYDGSAVHFFTSLYENRLKEDGFFVQVAKDVTGMGRLIDAKDANVYQFLRGGTTDISKRLPFENLLYVTYDKEFESREYQEVKSRRSIGHASVSRLVKQPQQSWISIMDGFESIEFEPNGYVYNPVSFYSAGYWGFEKIAEMIPLDYRPKSDN